MEVDREYRSALRLKKFDPNVLIENTDLMELAVKYEIVSLQTIILQHLRDDWAQSLGTWDYLQRQIITAADEIAKQADKRLSGLFLDDIFPEPASAIRFALRFNCPEVWPYAGVYVTAHVLSTRYIKVARLRRIEFNKKKKKKKSTRANTNL